MGQKLVLIGAVGMLFCSVHRSIFSVGIVPIKEQLGLSGSQVGVLQSAYLFGYMLTNQLGGVLVDKLGGAPVLLSCLALWSVVICSMPLMTMTAAPVAALAAARFVFGLLTGPALPGAVAAVSQWLSPATRSQGLANVYVAFNLGTALGCFLGQLIPVIGWPALFYVFGGLGVAWATGGLAVTKALTSATPQPAAEARGRRARRAGGGKLSRYQIGQLFALTHVFNCINWSFFILQNWLPTYMVTLGLDLKKSAGLSALPFLMMAICSKVGGAVAQNLIKAKGWETIKVRRLMILISSLIPAAALRRALRRHEPHGRRRHPDDRAWIAQVPVLPFSPRATRTRSFRLSSTTRVAVRFVPPCARFKKSRSFCSFGYHAHLTDVAPSSVGTSSVLQHGRHLRRHPRQPADREDPRRDRVVLGHLRCHGRNLHLRGGSVPHVGRGRHVSRRRA